MNLSSFATAISSLIYPTRCPSCGKGNCTHCRKTIRGEVSITFRGPLQIYAGSKYSPGISRIILSAKEENQIAARLFLAECLTESLKKAIEEISQKRNRKINKVFLIPIPSRKIADRKRGFAHIELLLKSFIELNQEINFQALDCLYHSKKIIDQSSLNFSERAMNMKGAFAVNIVRYFEIYPTRNSDSVVFLVDDLVTSGATVQAANSALSTLGARLDGVLASCATQGFSH